jgi:integrase/recombinase XerD
MEFEQEVEIEPERGTRAEISNPFNLRAGIRTSSRSGRRTFATRPNAKGVGMRTIQKLMDHRNIWTTALYCDVSEQTLRNAVELV